MVIYIKNDFKSKLISAIIIYSTLAKLAATYNLRSTKDVCVCMNVYMHLCT